MKNIIVIVLRWFVLRAFRVQATFSPEAMQALKEETVIVQCNHVSLLDGVIVALLSPAPLVFAVDPVYARQTMWAVRGMQFLSWLDLGWVVPVDARNPMGMRELARALAHGRSAMIFPEGEISPTGQRQQAQPGLAWLVARAGVRVVSGEISGAEQSRLFAKAGSRLRPRIGIKFNC